MTNFGPDLSNEQTTHMKKVMLPFGMVVLAGMHLTLTAFTQVGINTSGANPHSSAGLDVDFSDKGFLPPRMSTAERDLINPAADGLIIFNTTTGCINLRNAGAWNAICPVGAISTLSCNLATNNGSLISGAAASSVNSVVGYTGGNGGSHSGQTVSSTGVTGLTAVLNAGIFALGAGTLTYTISGTPSASGTASFELNIGGQTCVLTRSVSAGAIVTINCAGATHNGTLTSGSAAISVNSVVAYTGGNGGSHSGQTVSSTGVTGLTAALNSGTFASGSGTLIYTITGTPSSAGTASFALNIGGQICTLTRTVATPPCGSYSVTFNYRGSSVTYGTVQGANNKCWLDRNLGATAVATSSTHSAAFGDRFQWGRRDDGHQLSTSSTTSTLSATDQPVHGNFITNLNAPWDWRSPQNDNLWQGVNGVNNPCPSGWRIPTEAELNTERLSWSTQNAAGAFASPLKLPLSGVRIPDDGSVWTDQTRLWSSSVSTSSSRVLFISGSQASMIALDRGWGGSVRCILD